MNIDVPGVINAAVPEAHGRNARILAQNSSSNTNNASSHRSAVGWLSDGFPRTPPKLYVTAEDDDFDAATLQDWANEGFNVEYLGMGNGGKEYFAKLRELNRAQSETGGPCETFGIVAYGDAASLCLEHYHVLDNNPESKLGLLVAYYPTRIPDPAGAFPAAIRPLVHLPVGQVGVVKQTQVIGLQGKKKVSKKRIDHGLGVGGLLAGFAWKAYAYAAEAGFAEQDLDTYDATCAELAWSRSVATARRAFGNEVDWEGVVEGHLQAKYYTRNLAQTMASHAPEPTTPYLTHMPTLTGGTGPDELEHFYADFFLTSHPPSLELTLVSRTQGADRVVDELHVAFEHTQPMPWILPGVPATGKKVEIMVVSIFRLKGGRLASEHVYWDQASVLLQTGLLNRKTVPRKWKEQGVERLPVQGREPAVRVLDGFDDDEGQADNELIPDFWDEDDEEGEEGDEDGDMDGRSVGGSARGAGPLSPHSVGQPFSPGANGNGGLPHRPKGARTETGESMSGGLGRGRTERRDGEGVDDGGY